MSPQYPEIQRRMEGKVVKQKFEFLVKKSQAFLKPLRVLSAM